MKMEKIATFAPIPSASEAMATAVTRGVLISVLKANLSLLVVMPTSLYPAFSTKHPTHVDGRLFLSIDSAWYRIVTKIEIRGQTRHYPQSFCLPSRIGLYCSDRERAMMSLV